MSTPKASDSCACGKQRPTHPGDQQGHQDGGERQHHIAQAHEHGVDPAAAKPRQQPSATPTTTDSTTEAIPTISEMRAP
jgi:hypothetical protein